MTTREPYPVGVDGTEARREWHEKYDKKSSPFKIINQEAGVISEDPFKLVLISNPTSLQITLAEHEIGGFGLWGGSVGVDFKDKVPDEVIEEYLGRLR